MGNVRKCFLKLILSYRAIDLKRYMYKLTALTPLCFQALTIPVSYIALQKNILSKYIPGDFLINMIFLYDFCYKDIEQKPQLCLCIVVGLDHILGFCSKGRCTQASQTALKKLG